MTEYYYYGVAAAIYIALCWMFAVVRWFHTCQQPKEHRAAIWPDRKLQCIIYLMPTFLLPYAINPSDSSAWLMYKSYFPACYYFYSATLLLCFFGSLRQWGQWKTASWIGAIITSLTMAPLVMNAWVPGGILNEAGIALWNNVVMVVSLVMVLYSLLAMWQVWQWMKQARDDNFSNPDDFPMRYARRVWLAPIIFTPMLFPAYLMDSPTLRAVSDMLLSVCTVLMLLHVLPIWKRVAVVTSMDDDHNGTAEDSATDAHQEELMAQTAVEIEAFVRDQKAYLDPHLKVDDVVEHCQLGRTYVSITFQRHFGSFSVYVNRLRLAHYDQYFAQHPEETKESAALASGFSNYLAYYRAKQKLEGKK